MGLASFADCCCCLSGFGEELYKDWDNHPAGQQYTFIKRLGEGGFSEVQLAKDDLTGKTVALKIVFLNKSGLKPEERRILAGEAKLLRMVAHPNIVRCMRVLETRRQQVLVLEHLSGGEMLQQLQRVKRYTEAHACQLFRQVVDAVAYLHSLGIMHRDIKPENCLLGKPAQYYKEKKKPVKVKLIDLGMAGLYRPRKLLYGCMGSPGFIAPEVVLGDAHTPAMDIYSLGVLLFIMLVGRKPWDSQRSHTLQYAVLPTANAPGITDPVFQALSSPAKQLLLAMLHEEPGERPSAEEVLSHPWMLHKRQAPGGNTAAAAPERLIQPAVQQRLRMLGNSRQIMGTARGMMLLHSRGSRAGAIAFHKAVKEARSKLQQQAAALKAAGQLPEITGVAGTASSAKQQADAAEVPANTAVATLTKAADGIAAVRPTAAACGAVANRLVTSDDGGKVSASNEPNLARPVSYADPLSAAAQPTAGNSGPNGAPLKHRRNCSMGELARASLQQQSLLFSGLQRPPAVQQAGAASAAMTSNSKLAAGTAAGVGGYFEAPDAALVAEALDRGMSVPNPELVTHLSYPDHNHQRFGRAVSLSPGALALLDVDDQLCLLAAGTSAEDDEYDGMALFSWANKRGTADLVASFKQRYPAKPVIKTLVKLGHSLSTSLSRSLRNTAGGLLGSYRSGRYSPTRYASTDMPEANLLGSVSGGQAAAARGTVPLLSAGGASDMPEQEKSSSTRVCSVDRRSSAGVETSSAGAVGFTCDNSQLVQVPGQPEAKKSQQHRTQSASGLAQTRRQPGAAGVHEGSSPAADQSLDDAAVATGDHAGAGGLALVKNSLGCSIELAFLGPMMSMSPPRSPPAETPSADAAQRTLENFRSPVTAVSAADGTMKCRRPPTAAAAAAANKHFKQHHRQRESGHHLQGIVPDPAEPAIAGAASETRPATGDAPGGDSQQQQHQLQQLRSSSAALNPFSDAAGAAEPTAVTSDPLLARRVSRRTSSGGTGSHKGSAHATSNISISLSAAGNSKALLVSPSIRAAATAAATAAEEEGCGLPNGLWLQQSQSLSSAGALSPAPDVLCYASGLGLELTAARTLSSVVTSPKGLMTHDSMLDVTFAEQQPSGAFEQTLPPAATVVDAGAVAAVEGHQQQDPAEAVQQAGDRQLGMSSMQSHNKQHPAETGSRIISVSDWVEPSDSLQAWQVAETVRDISVIEWLGSEDDRSAVAAAAAHSSSTACSGTAASESRPVHGSQQQQQSLSRHVAVPHSRSGTGGRHCYIKRRRWSSSNRHGKWKPAISSEDDPGSVNALTVAANASVGETETAMLGGAMRGSAAAEQDVEQDIRQSTGADEEQEQNFYVGSFNDTSGLVDGQQLRYADRYSAGDVNADGFEDIMISDLQHAAASTAAPTRDNRSSANGIEEDTDPALLIGLEESMSVEQPPTAECGLPVPAKGPAHISAARHQLASSKNGLGRSAQVSSEQQDSDKVVNGRSHVHSRRPTFDDFDEPTSWYYAN